MADSAFLPWDKGTRKIFGEDFEAMDLEGDLPNYWAWVKRLNEREAVKKVMQDHADAGAAASR